MTKITKKTIQQMPCKFGRFGSGDETCSISVKMDREGFAAACGLLSPADQFMGICCGTICDAELRIDFNAQRDAGGQAKLKGMEDDYTTLASRVKLPSGKVSARSCSMQLTFQLSELNDSQVESLLRMSCRDGLVTLRRKGALEAAKRESDDGDDGVDGQETFDEVEK